MTTAADGEMIAGSARLERVADVFGVEIEPLVIETTGQQPIVIVRKDIPNATDPRAQRLSLADNRVAELSLAWDPEVLVTYDADFLESLWQPEELSALGDAWVKDVEFPEYDESVADGIAVCRCPTCGHEHAAKKN